MRVILTTTSFAMLLMFSATALAQSQSVHRKHLRWLSPQLGHWTGTMQVGDDSVQVVGKANWILKRNFVMSRWSGDDGRESLEIYGWNPAIEKVQRWTFLQDGTFVSSVLTSRNDSERVWDSEITTRNGSRLSMQFVVEFSGEKDAWTASLRGDSGDPLSKLSVQRASEPQDLSVDPRLDAPSHYEHLKMLEPRLGDWRGDFEYSHAGQMLKLKAVSELSWILNKNFQMTETRFVRDGENTGAVVVITGWDPVDQKVRSWMATSWGNYSEGELVEIKGVDRIWKMVDTNIDGKQQEHRDVARVSPNHEERSLTRYAADGSVSFALKLRQK